MTVGHEASRAITRPIVAVAIVALAAGYGQFGAVAALGEVARSFGHTVHGTTVAEQAGLSGTVLGVGLATLRLASIVGLPLAALADRWGRRGVLLWWTAVGLVATMAAAASPTYWWFVVIFALGRPFLSAAAALTHVVTAELSRPAARATALAVVSAGYGLGAGINALTHAALRGTLGFRALFLTSVVPLIAIIIIGRWIPEPRRVPTVEEAKPRFGSVGRAHRRRLATVMGLIFATSMISAPASSFVFLFAENVAHLQKGIETAMIASAALVGFVGLHVGRRIADTTGRRSAIALGVSGLALSSVILYSGGRVGVVVGYLAGVLASGLLAPAGTALPSELFPTEVRASVAGWGIVASVVGGVAGLVSFGFVVDASGSFAWAAIATATPFVLSLLLVRRLSETRGVELSGTIGSESKARPL